MSKATTIKVGNSTYPLYRTMRGMIDFERSRFTPEDLMKGNIEAILYSLFCTARGASIREGVAFEMDFEAFVDKVEPDAMQRLGEMNEETEPEVTPAPEPVEKKRERRPLVPQRKPVWEMTEADEQPEPIYKE